MSAYLKKSFRYSFFICCTFSLFSCLSTNQTNLQYALLTTSIAINNIELIAQAMLNNRSVKLADNAFQQTSFVNIQRHTAINKKGQLLNGREQASTHITLSLLIEGENCYLQNEQNQQSRIIKNISCIINPKANEYNKLDR